MTHVIRTSQGPITVSIVNDELLINDINKMAVLKLQLSFGIPKLDEDDDSIDVDCYRRIISGGLSVKRTNFGLFLILSLVDPHYGNPEYELYPIDNNQD